MKFMKFIVVMKTDTKIEFNKVEVGLPRVQLLFWFLLEQKRATLLLFVMTLRQIELVVKII